MLFLLTGDVQIGKTRWLEDLCASLQAAGTCVAGVVAPGQWVPRPEGQPGGKHGFDGAGRFEKLGIDNVLLPQGERIEFARRRDLAAGGKAFAEGAQAKAAKLGWAISDTAIAQVNAHFATLAKQAANETRLAPHAMLVVDELGRLELLRGCGLINALAILDGEAVPAGGFGLAKQLKDEIADCPPIVVLIIRVADAWLATWSRADATVMYPVDPVRLPTAVAEVLRAGLSQAV